MLIYFRHALVCQLMPRQRIQPRTRQRFFRAVFMCDAKATLTTFLEQQISINVSPHSPTFLSMSPQRLKRLRVFLQQMPFMCCMSSSFPVSPHYTNPSKPVGIIIFQLYFPTDCNASQCIYYASTHSTEEKAGKINTIMPLGVNWVQKSPLSTDILCTVGSGAKHNWKKESKQTHGKTHIQMKQVNNNCQICQ